MAIQRFLTNVMPSLEEVIALRPALERVSIVILANPTFHAAEVSITLVDSHTCRSVLGIASSLLTFGNAMFGAYGSR